MEEPTFTQLVNKSFSDILGGNSITKTLVKQHDTFNSMADANSSVSRMADAAIGSSILADIGSPTAKFAGSVAVKAAGTSALSAFMADRFDMGKFFAPLPGNWH